MKQYKFLISTIIVALVMISFNLSQAQNFDLVDDEILFNETVRACITVSVDPEEKTLKDAWLDYLKDNYDLKLRGRNILSAEEVKVQQITSNTINFYTIIEEDNNGSTMKVFVSKGYDINIDEENYPAEYNSVKNIVANFLKQTLPNYYNKMVLDTKERIQELAKEKKSIEESLEKESQKLKDLELEIKASQEHLLEKEGRLNAAKEKLNMRLEKLERIRSELQKL